MFKVMLPRLAGVRPNRAMTPRLHISETALVASKLRIKVDLPLSGFDVSPCRLPSVEQGQYSWDDDRLCLDRVDVE